MGVGDDYIGDVVEEEGDDEVFRAVAFRGKGDGPAGGDHRWLVVTQPEFGQVDAGEGLVVFVESGEDGLPDAVLLPEDVTAEAGGIRRVRRVGQVHPVDAGEEDVQNAFEGFAVGGQGTADVIGGASAAG